MTTTAQPVRDSLGDRIKNNYELRARHMLTRRTPVVVRVDGKAFHTFTRGLEKPYDRGLIDAMAQAALRVAEDMQGFKLAYVQSDEASFLLTDYDRFETEAWFDYCKSKVESITASAMTAHFNRALARQIVVGDRAAKLEESELLALCRAKPGEVVVASQHTLASVRWVDTVAMFDARAFNLPREEVANYFLWRAKDWERNSVQMMCQAHFSPKQMHGKGKADQHDLLHSIGKNWATDTREVERNGTWIVRTDAGLVVRHDIQPVFGQIDAVVSPLIVPQEA